ncbi:ankyrin repeat domain-containing protein [Streptomyces cinerochromogenes]|uniref:ankyrin repeat domain-containing protein n=1 Tax=Streptomyces cinerochromogenes TaxID=66422 RepID=UPI0033AF525B
MTDTDTSDESQWTPAHKAVETSDYEALTVLLASGTDPNERCFGHTLLTHALDVEGDSHLQTGYPWNTAATAVLLAYGADPQLPADDGQTPLQLAEYYGHVMAQALLMRFISAR